MLKNILPRRRVWTFPGNCSLSDRRGSVKWQSQLIYAGNISSNMFMSHAKARGVQSEPSRGRDLLKFWFLSRLNWIRFSGRWIMIFHGNLHVKIDCSIDCSSRQSKISCKWTKTSTRVARIRTQENSFTTNRIQHAHAGNIDSQHKQKT